MGVPYILADETLKREEKQCVEKLKKANAISEESAVNPEEAGISGFFLKRAIERLKKRGIVKETEDGRIHVVCKDKNKC